MMLSNSEIICSRTIDRLQNPHFIRHGMRFCPVLDKLGNDSLSASKFGMPRCSPSRLRALPYVAYLVDQQNAGENRQPRASASRGDHSSPCALHDLCCLANCNAITFEVVTAALRTLLAPVCDAAATSKRNRGGFSRAAGCLNHDRKNLRTSRDRRLEKARLNPDRVRVDLSPAIFPSGMADEYRAQARLVIEIGFKRKNAQHG